MASERHPRPAPRERTFAELFPWRNLRRAAALVVLILAIVVIKRSVGAMLTRVGSMWFAPPRAPASVSTPAGRDVTGGGFGVHLGPGLAPSRGAPAPAPSAPAPPPPAPSRAGAP